MRAFTLPVLFASVEMIFWW